MTTIEYSQDHRLESTASGDDRTEAADALSLDRTFEILSNRRRRCVIRYLQKNEGAVSLRDLAEQIAAWENETSIGDVTYQERKRVYTSLYQSHLPKMSQWGIVDYHQNRGLIEPTPAVDEFHAYVEGVREDEPKGGGPFGAVTPAFGVAAILWGTVVLAWLGMVPLLSAAGFELAFAVSTMVVVATGVQGIANR